MFHASFLSGEKFASSTSKVVCVGRNYAEHALELNNPVPDEPILFIKPESSIVNLISTFKIPESDCHYEAEISVLIGKELSNASLEEVKESIAGIGMALDLTKRSLQSELKQKMHPWEIAKGFDGACPISPFIHYQEIDTLDKLTFSLMINDEIRQTGSSADMITPIISLIAFISQHFTLREGDIVLTGTPKGVGALNVNDKLTLSLNNQLKLTTEAISYNV